MGAGRRIGRGLWQRGNRRNVGRAQRYVAPQVVVAGHWGGLSGERVQRRNRRGGVGDMNRLPADRTLDLLAEQMRLCLKPLATLASHDDRSRGRSGCGRSGCGRSGRRDGPARNRQRRLASRAFHAFAREFRLGRESFAARASNGDHFRGRRRRNGQRRLAGWATDLLAGQMRRRRETFSTSTCDANRHVPCPEVFVATGISCVASIAARTVIAQRN